MFTVIATCVVIGSAVVGCNVAPDGAIGSHHVIAEGVAFEGDLVHGDRLDIIMVGDADWVATCNDMGGEPIFDPAKPESIAFVCEDVDF
jgi:hypothetical protein